MRARAFTAQSSGSRPKSAAAVAGRFPGRGQESAKAARWTHLRYKGSVNLEPGLSEAVEVAITSPDRGDEARLLSSFLGWLDRHFGEQLSSINIQYQNAAPARRRR